MEKTIKRRELLGWGAGLAAADILPVFGVEKGPGTPSRAPAVLSSYSTAEHRKRMENIGVCERGIRGCLRKSLVTSYIPGHAVYDVQNKTWDPDERDEQALARFRDAGIGLIQPWSGWADSSWGRNHLVARNPGGFRRFVDLVHKHGMKVYDYLAPRTLQILRRA